MSESGTENRLGKLETRMELMAASVDTLARNQTSFQEEWRTKADEDRKAHRSARLTFPQIVGMLVGTVTMTAILLGGLMYLINVSSASVRSDLTSQIGSAKQSAEAANAQTGLTVRGMVDGITALNTGMQTLQREQATDRVKLGLVEQQAKANTAFIDKAQSFDAFMAGHDERLKALEQTVRDIASRR